VKKDWCSREFNTLVTLGESTTAGGWSTTRERCWASLLAALISDCAPCTEYISRVAEDEAMLIIHIGESAPARQLIGRATKPHGLL